MPVRRPTKEELAAAVDLTIEDIIGSDLKVLFCGINPGLYSGATGLHFARPGNRFWKVLYGAGFTERLLDPSEEAELLDSGYGITCFVDRTTARADELSKEEILFSHMVTEPEIVDVSKDLFESGFYNQSVSEAFKALNKYIQHKAGRNDVSDTSLMSLAFSRSYS